MFHQTYPLRARSPPRQSHPSMLETNSPLPYRPPEYLLAPHPPSSNSNPNSAARAPVSQFLTPRGRWYLIGGGIVVFSMGLYTANLLTSLARSPTSISTSTASAPSPTHQADFTRIYDTTASEYDALVATSEALMGMSLLRRSLARRSRGDVLEASCGTGRNLKYFRWDRVRSVTCVDASREMVGVAREKAEDMQDSRGLFASKGTGMKGRVRWVVGGLGKGVPRAPVLARGKEHGERSGEKGEKEVSAEMVEESEKMPVVRPDAQDDEGKYDTVIQSLGFCSTDKPVQLLRGLARATKSDGKLVLLEHGRSHFQWLNQILDRSASEHARMHGCWWNRDINRIVEESGLETVKIWRCHLGTTYWVELKPPGQELVQKWDREEAEMNMAENVRTVVSKKAKWWNWSS